MNSQPIQSATNTTSQTTSRVYSNSKKVSCSGYDHSRHPLVYLQMTKNDSVVCPYCNKFFILKNQAN